MSTSVDLFIDEIPNKFKYVGKKNFQCVCEKHSHNLSLKKVAGSKMTLIFN